MRIKFPSLFFLLIISLPWLHAQGTVPVFQQAFGQQSYAFVGREPAGGSTTTIPTLLVPIRLSFGAKETGGKPFVMDAEADAGAILHSPVFSPFVFPSGGTTQYADAMLRTTFSKADGWHTLLGKPDVKPVEITIPRGYGYILTSKQSGRSFAVVDVDFLRKELFQQLPRQEGKLVIAVAHNTTYYADGDATLCCSWGTHGVDPASGNSFVLGSYIHSAPAVIEDADVQPLTQQLAEFLNDPLHNPQLYGRNLQAPGNTFPSGWMRPGSVRSEGFSGCGGNGIGSAYFLLEPTDTNPKNHFPVSKAFVAHLNGAAYHLQNVALLPWYLGASKGQGGAYSFPAAEALREPAQPCPSRRGRFRPGGGPPAFPPPTVASIPLRGPPNGHHLIGYWGGRDAPEIAPQWDIIIVAFATPDRNAPPGILQFRPPAEPASFQADIAYLKGQGRKVMISLGGGGVSFDLADPPSVPAFVSSVTSIVSQYGFDGVDIDFETPSLALNPGDTDFRHPTTPSVVNLISALRQLQDHFGPHFMISLVPEGTQIPSGYPSYGGQFGSYLPLTYALRDILSFVDVQDYNTPPLEGLDGEIYQPGSVDYHAAMTELLLHGFNVGGDPQQFFPPMPADKVAVGFLVGDTTPAIVSDAMEYIITGKAPAGTTYKLRQPGGYPGMIGAMFWTLDADRRDNYKFSNVVGPQLHGYPPATQPNAGATSALTHKPG